MDTRSTNEPGLPPDLELAQIIEIVRDCAREELLPRFARVGYRFKPDGSILTEADLAMDRRLHAELIERWPDTAFLSEEMPESQQLALLDRPSVPLWCLDPLDGTSNFAAGVPLFAVSLALLLEGRSLMGVIYDPVRDECFSARAGNGAWLNGERLQPRRIDIPLARTLALVDLKRLPSSLAKRLAKRPPYASQRNLGTCAIEWCWMAAGRGHVYLHGGQRLWDHAAGSLILSEAGCCSCTLDGEPVFKTTMAPRSVISCADPKLFADWRDWLYQHNQPDPPD